MKGVAVAALVLLATTACSGGSVGADSTPTAAPSPAASQDVRLRATLGGVALLLEVADTEAERAVGLMDRTSVPAGTGMVFTYDGLSTERYYMFHVPVPLKAVFIRDGTVVSAVDMVPCGLEDPYACPTYGADGPYDTVVETAPSTLPEVAPGDAFVLPG